MALALGPGLGPGLGPDPGLGPAPWQVGRAYSSALQHAALALEEATTPRAVDAVLAAAGGGGAMALLHGVDYTGLLPTRLFAPPMLGSAIVLFGGPAPPPPGMLVLSSMGAFLIGTALHH